jgi:hypothetical protein
MTDLIDRVIEILDGFEVPYDDLGIGLHHTVCRANVGSDFALYNYAGNAETHLDDTSLGGLVKAAITHAAAWCPGRAALPEEPERKPCGDVHTGPCEVVDREETPDGVWLNVRHLGGEGRVFLGEVE